MKKRRKKIMSKEFIWIAFVVSVWVILVFMIIKTIGG